MNLRPRFGRPPVLLLALLLCARFAGAETFRVATYNLESYLDQPTETRPAKLAAAKAKVRESILALKPDVLALQEMGRTNALLELRDSLKAEGLDLPYWEHVSGFDTNIHVAILSRFPFTARRPHTDDSFLLSGRRFRVSRGFARSGYPGQHELLLHPHRRPPQIQARHRPSRRSRAAPRRSQTVARED